ncbi:hypothetical protein [Mesorhizobium sp. 1M-11]|uniref:hypothetical protein n=1 Tax=Mesorhizobium sp. 1M-11 TaxID=1529006 RepID=UPI0006C742E8|nr:hypothetical protein [Mesorhizobium sp. 1M-11]
MTGAKKKLSPAMRKVLENLIAGRRPNHGFPGGRSVSGDLSGTYVALFRRRFIDPNTGKVTEAGRSALGDRS